MKTSGSIIWLAAMLGSATAIAGSSTWINVVVYTLPTAGSNTRAISSGRDGALWFTEYDGNKIGRITTEGMITEYPVPTAKSNPAGIAAGADGALWFTEYSGNKIGRITTTGMITEYLLPDERSLPLAITAGPDGALWFIAAGAGIIGRITTGGVVTKYPIPENVSPTSIVAGPDGALWFTQFYVESLGRMTTEGVFTEYPGVYYAGGITAGPDGALWFTEADPEGAGKIGRMTTSGVLSEYFVDFHPVWITVGPDEELWSLQQLFGSSLISRITTEGMVTEYPLPPYFSGPITAGSDGGLWFANGDTIGRIPACSLGLSASFANDTLTMTFHLGISTPANWYANVYTSSGEKKQIWSKLIPAVVPPAAFTVKSGPGFPEKGKVRIVAGLQTARGENLCKEMVDLDTTQ